MTMEINPAMQLFCKCMAVSTIPDGKVWNDANIIFLRTSELKEFNSDVEIIAFAKDDNVFFRGISFYAPEYDYDLRKMAIHAEELKDMRIAICDITIDIYKNIRRKGNGTIPVRFVVAEWILRETEDVSFVHHLNKVFFTRKGEGGYTYAFNLSNGAIEVVTGVGGTVRYTKPCEQICCAVADIYKL